jgi:ABC-type transport system involved in multi-copper enzyme maturation permease subunit
VSAALRYEWVRVLTVRSTWICLVLAFVGVGGLAFLASNPVYLNASDTGLGDPTVLWWEAFSQPLLLTAILASVIAAQNLGQEYRFGLIRLTLTAFPQRGRILLAKALSVVVVALVFTAVSYAASWIGVTLHGYPTPPSSASAVDSTYLLRGAVFLVLWCLSAWALAGVTRQTAVGIAVPLVSGLIVEQILSAVLRDRLPWLVDVLPWSTASRWSLAMSTSGFSSDGSADVTSGPPVGWSAVGVFACWVLAFVIVEVTSFLRRDA